MVAIKSKCFDETVLCRIDNSLYRVSNCPFHAGDQSLCHSHRYPGVFLIRFFLNDARHATQKRAHRKCSLILNAEIELKSSLLRKDACLMTASCYFGDVLRVEQLSLITMTSMDLFNSFVLLSTTAN